ncbi:hypothetical protein C9374_003511 [Naegleria lovaniensis]|uniref:Uncharacterized protein n=1 Tax=Naegleria lovaniensis TaxID=51637 RepID=A0AA88GP34_NAELO|nr:uncharacterized protein C9374_003511 [Naegleria lovaniensis]KAG2385696.1 hypothetical protein C9374_003511 [Naegleria lovaniensis]
MSLLLSSFSLAKNFANYDGYLVSQKLSASPIELAHLLSFVAGKSDTKLVETNSLPDLSIVESTLKTIDKADTSALDSGVKSGFKMLVEDEELRCLVLDNLWVIIKTLGSDGVKHMLKAIQVLPGVLVVMNGNLDPQSLTHTVKGGLEMQAIQFKMVKEGGKGAKVIYQIIKRIIDIIRKKTQTTIESRDDLTPNQREELTKIVNATTPLVESDEPNNEKIEALLHTLRPQKYVKTDNVAI